MDQDQRARFRANLERIKDDIKAKLEATREPGKRPYISPYNTLEIESETVTASLNPFFFGRKFYNEMKRRR
jgi:hypothetical protein